jgi:hypothetical protein
MQFYHHPGPDDLAKPDSKVQARCGRLVEGALLMPENTGYSQFLARR